MIHSSHAVTITCDSDDCFDSVQVIDATEHAAGYRAAGLARGDGWASYAGTNGGTFHRCPMHRDEVACTDDCAYDCLGHAFDHQRPLARY